MNNFPIEWLHIVFSTDERKYDEEIEVIYEFLEDNFFEIFEKRPRYEQNIGFQVYCMVEYSTEEKLKMYLARAIDCYYAG